MRTLGIVFPGCSPFDKLRANGSAFWGSSSPAVRPATGSGRTEAHFGIVFAGCAPFDRLRANGSAHWGSSSLTVHPSTGSGRTEAHIGDRLPRLCTLRQAQGERKCILGIVFPGSTPFDRLRANGLRCQRQSAYNLRRVDREPSQASRRSPLWHCPRAF